ncbi:alpha-(1,3)-fucosyltransferase C-like [Physella acuta]|uniref:alpha-(1,3)-fucosyltransferase C-like n=1 Tax=Physella acuta TaxID=109671 RepID=UPI0027DBAB8A|nr:alpha-(1,3)-fucosyltransferase C-like [Physella acuta]
MDEPSLLKSLLKYVPEKRITLYISVAFSLLLIIYLNNDIIKWNQILPLSTLGIINISDIYSPLLETPSPVNNTSCATCYTTNLTNVTNTTLSWTHLHLLENATTTTSTPTTTNRTSVSILAPCNTSPYILCPNGTRANSNDTKTYSIAVLRRPSWIPDSDFDFASCEFSNCKFVDTNVNEMTDVVLVYAVGLSDGFRPPQRWAHQIYGVMMWESPIHTHASFISDAGSVWNKAFNMTIHYRTDSDVFVPYDRLVYSPRPQQELPNYYEIAKSKTKMAMWMVSNCGAPSKRNNYVQEMQKYIEVDIYGACGQPCKQEVCDDLLRHHYKFYLSFENSHCKDYITEKLFKAYNPDTHIIPVARGGAPYGQYLPNNTMINAADFKTPKDLALFLKNLASDLNRYAGYLAEKDKYRHVTEIPAGISSVGCQVCKKLHTHTFNKIHDMNQWIQEGACITPHDV